jgi:hypothetical protein
MLSSYAISTMILHLFACNITQSPHPLGVLRTFLQYYSQFQWDRYALFISGPVALSCYNGTDFGASFGDLTFLNRSNLSRNISNRLSALIIGCRGLPITPHFRSDQTRFPIRSCNIMDPLNPTNNLGMSVARHNMTVLTETLKNGSQHLESILLWRLNKIRARK